MARWGIHGGQIRSGGHGFFAMVLESTELGGLETQPTFFPSLDLGLNTIWATISIRSFNRGSRLEAGKLLLLLLLTLSSW
jgi:hypothetical protein